MAGSKSASNGLPCQGNSQMGVKTVVLTVFDPVRLVVGEECDIA
jgi:hypothetical protein